MRVFSRKSFEFNVGGATYRTRPLEFATLPDTVAKTLLFRLAVKDGSLEVIETKKAQALMENNGDKPIKRKKKADESAEVNEKELAQDNKG